MADLFRCSVAGLATVFGLFGPCWIDTKFLSTAPTIEFNSGTVFSGVACRATNDEIRTVECEDSVSSRERVNDVVDFEILGATADTNGVGPKFFGELCPSEREVPRHPDRIFKIVGFPTGLSRTLTRAIFSESDTGLRWEWGKLRRAYRTRFRFGGLLDELTVRSPIFPPCRETCTIAKTVFSLVPGFETVDLLSALVANDHPSEHSTGIKV